MIEDYSPGVNFKVQLKRHFIDPGAWYHIVVVVDTTVSSPASDRVRIYVNGIRETEFEGTPTYPSENYDTSVNDTGEHKIGQFPGNTNFPFKGYFADVHLVDGTAVTETNGVIDEFGEFDSYNVWQPKIILDHMEIMVLTLHSRIRVVMLLLELILQEVIIILPRTSLQTLVVLQKEKLLLGLEPKLTGTGTESLRLKLTEQF